MKQTKRVLTAILPLAATLFFAAGEVQAYVTSDGSCTPGNVTLTSITASVGGGSVYSGPALDATSCFGVVSGNDSGNGQAKGNNIGELNDGLLNGGQKQDGQGIDPLTFIDASQLLDLNGNGTATDPGWIYLGKYGDDGFEAWNKPLDISTILDFKVNPGTGSTSGTWTLSTDPDIIQTVIDAGVLTDRSLFDHLALILKAGNGYVVYDFDFNELQDDLGPDFNYTTPYILSGNWSTGDLENKGLSHMSVWARDPLGDPTGGDDPEPIPAAGTLLLLGLGLTLLGARARKHS